MDLIFSDLGFELCVAVGLFTSSNVNIVLLLAYQLSFAWDLPETADGLMRMKPRKPGK